MVDQDLRKEHRRQIESAVAGLREAWSVGDGNAFGSFFAEDADFTVWFGIHLEGRSQISEAHQQIFDSFYQGTEYGLAVGAIRFLGPDVAVVHLTGSIVGRGEPFPDIPQTVPMAVLTREGKVWQIVAFHNTRAEVEKRLGHGDVRID